VHFMNLKRILKNRKAMTPLMIGIIVAASVIAVIFIIFAGVVPQFKKEVHMMVQPLSIRGNSTDRESLIFRATCDYAPGKIIKVEIYKEVLGEQTLYGERDVLFSFQKNEVQYLQVRFFYARGGAPVQNSTHLLFSLNEDYTLKITYTDISGINEYTMMYDFTYKLT